MRRFVAAFLAVAVLAFALPLPSSAASDKQLKNRRGSVSIQSGGSTRAVAQSAVSPIANSDTAITGANSQGELQLPDSSYIVIGQNTQVTVDKFDMTDIAHAQFTVAQGKVRFKVVHPQGTAADYTFKTGTAQIAVRGTEGDVEFNNTTLQVNVYSTSAPNGVTVTLGNGQVFTLQAGQSLVVHFGAAALASAGGGASVSGVSTTSVQPFYEFGLPSNAGALGLIGPLSSLGILPVIGAVIVPIAAVTVAGNQTTSTTSGPNNTTVPVHIQIKLFKLRFP